MQSITDIIKPIKLLKGSHDDTDKTGQGCAMNVIAYLNGEDVITDESPCVCFTARPFIVWLNDALPDSRRHEMIPLMMRAMGSATEDREVLLRRLDFGVAFAQRCADSAARFAGSARSAIAASAVWAASAARFARFARSARSVSADSADSAVWAARSANAANAAAQTALLNDCLSLLDQMLPPADEPSPIVLQRARDLVAIAA